MLGGMARAGGWHWLVVAAIACGGPAHGPLAKAGDNLDEGGGELARQSIRLNLGDDSRELAQTEATLAGTGIGGDLYGGALYGGSLYGGDPYGGAGYAGWAVPQWNYSTPNRMPHYNIGGPLTSSLEGRVTWAGARPPKLATACGSIENPTVRVGADNGVRGVVVYIEKVTVARQLPYYSKPAGVGGVVAKHGCALVPAAQIVTPLPASVSVHGDAMRSRVRITPSGIAPKAYDLQEGGLIELEAKPGVTRIDGEDGKLVPAWVIALDTPYYALTDDSGRFRIDDLQPGTYDVTFWAAPIANASADAVIGFGAPTIVHRTVKVAGNRARIDLALPAR
jgi:hypothetical protein